jgi:hypothetical protein
MTRDAFFNEWGECEHVTRQTRGEDLQANIFAFEADALQVVIGNFVRNLKTDKKGWRSR